MKIMLPKEFQMPASAKPNEPFEAVATLMVDADGMVDLVSLDGVAIGEEMEMGEEEMAGEEMAGEEMAMEEEYADPEITMPFENA
jgi:hypothetical protein